MTKLLKNSCAFEMQVFAHKLGYVSLSYAFTLIFESKWYT